MFVSDPRLLIPALAVFHEVLSDLFVDIAVHHSPPKTKQSCGPEPGRPPVFLLWLKSGTSHFTTILWNKTSCQALHEELELLGGSQAWLWIQERVATGVFCAPGDDSELAVGPWATATVPILPCPSPADLWAQSWLKEDVLVLQPCVRSTSPQASKNDLNFMGLSSSLNFYNQSKDDIF